MMLMRQDRICEGDHLASIPKRFSNYKAANMFIKANSFRLH